MCDPFTIALMVGGMAASIGGTAISNNESQNQAADIAKARNKVLNETLAKNKEFADRSRQIFDTRVGDVNNNAATDIAQSQNDRTANIESNIQPAASAEAIVPSNAPKVVQSSLSQKLSDVFGESTAQAKRTGALTGYGGFFNDEAIKDASANRDVGVNADAISGNMRLMPSLQDFAQIGATKPSSGIGQMLSALGSVASSAAGARGLGVGAGAAADPGGFYKPNFMYLNKGTGMFGGGT